MKTGNCLCGGVVHDLHGATLVMSGTIDSATGITTNKHIFTAFKGDYYDI